jgi:hypothetical protein
MVRPTEGSTSQVGVVLASTFANAGKYRDGDVDGVNERNTGPVVFVDAGGIVWAGFT